jgi:hypothetical protein
MLAVARRILHQVGVGQLRRGRQYRRRDRDFIVESQAANDLGGRVRQRGQPLRQPLARLALDLGREPHQNVVEQRDLRAGEAAGPGDEQVRHVLQQLQAAPDAVGAGAGFNLVEDQVASGHFVRGPVAGRFGQGIKSCRGSLAPGGVKEGISVTGKESLKV